MPKKAMSKTEYKSIPPTETVQEVSCFTTSGDHYKITRNGLTNKHTLWKCNENMYLKIQVADSPYELYELIEWGDSK